jgi:hypothetical protein
MLLPSDRGPVTDVISPSDVLTPEPGGGTVNERYGDVATTERYNARA